MIGFIGWYQQEWDSVSSPGDISYLTIIYICLGDTCLNLSFEECYKIDNDLSFANWEFYINNILFDYKFYNVIFESDLSERAVLIYKKEFENKDINSIYVPDLLEFYELLTRIRNRYKYDYTHPEVQEWCERGLEKLDKYLYSI